jgi:hypothetical protein
MPVGLIDVLGDPHTADWLIEVPHGADEPRHYALVASLLQSELPPNLQDFFQVNTDVGSFELALGIRAALEREGQSVCLIRCGIPRTFVDVNRQISDDKQGFTPGLQPWITHPDDQELLTALHAAYSAFCKGAYRAVCGRGGRALIPHTYAPRSVPITDIDHSIVEQLRSFYDTERIEACPLRPEMDFITHTPEGVNLALPGVDGLIEQLIACGVKAEKGGSYTLHPITMGAAWSAAHPNQVLCFEVRRDLVTEWTPFRPQPIRHDRIKQIANAMVQGLLASR